jgi:cytochrome c-type biogenesis protein CcmH/NrfG
MYLEGIRLFAGDKLEEAIALWEKVLALDPGYTPAREHIEIAKKKLQFKKDIADLKNFD